jgi:hypothetical protein
MNDEKDKTNEQKRLSFSSVQVADLGLTSDPLDQLDKTGVGR